MDRFGEWLALVCLAVLTIWLGVTVRRTIGELRGVRAQLEQFRIQDAPAATRYWNGSAWVPLIVGDRPGGGNVRGDRDGLTASLDSVSVVPLPSYGVSQMNNNNAPLMYCAPWGAPRLDQSERK